MNKKIILKLILLSLLILLFATTAQAYQIPDEYRPINQPFAITGIELRTGEDAAGGTIIVLQILAGSLLYFAAPVAVLMLATAGILVIIRGDESEKLAQGKRAIYWSLIGLVTIIMSYSIVKIILKIILSAAEGNL